MKYMDYNTFYQLLVETKQLICAIECISKVLNCGVITENTLGDNLIEAILKMLNEHFEIKPDGENADIIINWLTDDECLTIGEIYDILTKQGVNQQ